MASGGSVSLGSSPNITFTVSYSVTRNLANVSISLSVSVSGISGASYYGYPLYGRPTVNGSQKSTYTLKNASPSQWSAFSVSLGTHSTTVSNLSQTSMPVSVYFTGNGKSATLSFSATLPNVAPDTITSSVDFVVGNDLPITIAAGSSSFSHSVAVSVAGTQVYTGPFTDPIPLASYADTIYALVTNANTASVSVTLTTYNGSTTVGSTTKTGTASFSAAECLPTFTTIAVQSSTYSLTGDHLTIIPTLSNLSVSASGATAKKSATMVSYFATCGGVSASAPYDAGGVTLSLPSVNSNVVTVQAIDSRGNSATVTQALTVLDYVKPQVGSVELVRDNAVDDTVKLTYSGKWWNQNFGAHANTLGARWQYKQTGEASYTLGATDITPTSSGDDFSFAGYITPTSGSWDSDLSYDIVVVVYDEIGTAQGNGAINLGVPAVDVRRSGATYYIGFGKVPAVSDMPNGGVDVAGDYFQNGSPLFPLGIANGGTGVSSLADLLTALGFSGQVNGYGGYIKFPFGVMIQWGSLGGYASAKRDNLTVDMPQAFANTQYAVMITGYYYSDNTNYETAGTSHVETVQRFTLHRFNTTGNYLNSMKWLAIGAWA